MSFSQNTRVHLNVCQSIDFHVFSCLLSLTLNEFVPPSLNVYHQKKALWRVFVIIFFDQSEKKS